MADGDKQDVILTSPQANANIYLMQEQLKLKNSIRSGADWFFWIAGASVINTVIFLFDANWFLLAGLAFPMYAAAIAREIGSFVEIISLIVTLICAGVYMFFGFFSRKRHMWAFVTGVAFYTIDGLLFFFN